MAANGIDLTDAPVEVAPIADYHMGGIGVDARLATRVSGLFAAGEAVGGANGANRLSGNAITEAFVFGHRAGRNAAADALRTPDAWHASAARPALDTLAERKEARGEGPSALALSHELRQLMWEQVGPLRDGAGLDGAVERIRRMRSEALSGLAVPACRAYDTGLADWYTLRAGPRGGGGDRRKRSRAAGKPGRPPARGFSRERRPAHHESDGDPCRRRACTGLPGGGLKPVSNTAILRIVRGGPGLAEGSRDLQGALRDGRLGARRPDLAAREPRPVARLPLQLHERERVQGMHDADRRRDHLRLHGPPQARRPWTLEPLRNKRVIRDLVTDTVPPAERLEND